MCVTQTSPLRNIAAADANRGMGKEARGTTADMTTKNPASGAIVRNGARPRSIGKCREYFFILKHLLFVKWGGAWLVKT